MLLHHRFPKQRLKIEYWSRQFLRLVSSVLEIGLVSSWDWSSQFLRLVSSVLEIGLVSSWNWSRQFLILILSSRLKQNFEGDLNWVRLSLTFFGPFPSIYFVHNQYFYWKFVKKPGFLFHILLGTMVLFFKFVEGARRNWRFQRLTGN